VHRRPFADGQRGRQRDSRRLEIDPAAVPEVDGRVETVDADRQLDLRRVRPGGVALAGRTARRSDTSGAGRGREDQPGQQCGREGVQDRG